MSRAEPDQLHQRTLLLLAGYPGVGKSTLLARGLSEGIALFGDADDQHFRFVRHPAREPDWISSAQEILESGSWFPERDLPFLASLAHLPSVVLVHVDLIALLYLFGQRMVHDSASADILARMPPTASTLADRSNMSAIYTCLLSLEVLRRFDRIVVNTLHAPWMTIARRWSEREAAKSPRVQATPRSQFIRKHVLNMQHPRRDIYHGVYGGWMDAVDALAPSVSLTTEVLDDHVRVRCRPGGVTVAIPLRSN